MSEQFVRDQANGRKWPHLRLGPRTVSFTPAHVQQIIAMTEVKPVGPTPRVMGRGKRLEAALRAIGGDISV